MKKVIASAIVLILLTTTAHAVFSSFILVTKDKSGPKIAPIVTVEAMPDHPDQVKVTVIDQSPIRTTVLLVTAEPIPDEDVSQHNFRDYIWYGKDNGRQIEEELIMISESDYAKSGKREAEAFFYLDKDKLNRTYLYEDSYEPIADGGYYFTVDLESFAGRDT